MDTLIIKSESNKTKAIAAFLKAFDVSFEIIKDTEKKEKTYDPEFVKMVLKRSESAKRGNTIEINPSDLWGSLGLK